MHPCLGDKKLRSIKTKTVDDYYHFLETEAEPATNMGKHEESRKPDKIKAFGCVSSVPEVTRTPDLPLRRRSLYPSELRKRTTPSIIISHRYHSDNYKFPSSGKLINPCSQILPLKRLPTAGSPYRSSLLMHSSNTRSLQLSVIR